MKNSPEATGPGAPKLATRRRRRSSQHAVAQRDATLGSGVPSRNGTPAPPTLDLRVLRSLRRIMRAVEIHSCRLAADHHITGPQLVCLLALRDEGPLTTSGLARHVHLSASTVVGILDRLEERALILRERDSTDRRRVNVSATVAGRELADQAPSPLQETLARALHELPELEQTAIALSLERIVTLMEAERIEAAPVLEAGPLNPPIDPVSPSSNDADTQ